MTMSAGDRTFREVRDDIVKVQSGLVHIHDALVALRDWTHARRMQTGLSEHETAGLDHCWDALNDIIEEKTRKVGGG